MHIFEGAVITGNEAGTTARFLVEEEGRIVHVGDVLPETYRSAPRTALGGGALVPALADTHVHFMSHALFASGLDVRSAATVGDLADRVRSFAAARKDRIVIGFGASAYAVAERRLPTRAATTASRGG